jgi:hypothetical protein
MGRDDPLAQVDHELSFRSGNQNPRIHLEIPSVKLLVAHKIRHGLALAPAADQLPKCLRLTLSELRFGSHQDIQTPHSPGMGKKQLSGQARGVHVALAQVHASRV